jgi:hypothetical protein
VPLTPLQCESMTREELTWVAGDQVFHFSFEHSTPQ